MKAKDSQDKGKTLKPLSAKKPPEAADSHAAIEDWIRQMMPGMQPIITQLDEIICQTIPGLQFAVKWQKAFYGNVEQGWMIEMVAYHVSVNIVFFAGAEIDPPPPLGTEGRSRYVKLRLLQEAQEPLIRNWIDQSGRIQGWK